MALYNEILVGRYNGILHKLLNMKEGAPAPTLSSDIQASIGLENDRPEWEFLGGEFRCTAPITKTADAANFGIGGLFNGQATGVLAVVERILINNTAAGAVNFQLRSGATTGLAATVRGIASDFRWLTKQSACLLGHASEAALTGNLIANFTVPGNSFVYVDWPFILPPFVPGMPVATNIVVATGAINTALQATFFWREHAMENSENR